jgi:hypothetical protein
VEAIDLIFIFWKFFDYYIYCPFAYKDFLLYFFVFIVGKLLMRAMIEANALFRYFQLVILLIILIFYFFAIYFLKLSQNISLCEDKSSHFGIYYGKNRFFIFSILFVFLYFYFIFKLFL